LARNRLEGIVTALEIFGSRRERVNGHEKNRLTSLTLPTARMPREVYPVSVIAPICSVNFQCR